MTGIHIELLRELGEILLLIPEVDQGKLLAILRRVVVHDPLALEVMRRLLAGDPVDQALVAVTGSRDIPAEWRNP